MTEKMTNFIRKYFILFPIQLVKAFFLCFVMIIKMIYASKTEQRKVNPSTTKSSLEKLSYVLAEFWHLFKALIEGALQEVNMLAEIGEKAPNPKMVRLGNNSECRLLDAATSASKPLIINFGSCT